MAKRRRHRCPLPRGQRYPICSLPVGGESFRLVNGKRLGTLLQITQAFRHLALRPVKVRGIEKGFSAQGRRIKPLLRQRVPNRVPDNRQRDAKEFRRSLGK